MMKAARMLMWVIAMAIVALPVQAQSCPGGLTNSLQILDGTTWVFVTQSASERAGQASIGRFTAKYVPATSSSPFARGVLSITQTLNQDGSIAGATGIAGRYSISADCSGGVLMFMLGGQQIQYEFVFTNNFTEMYLVAGQFAPFGYDVIWGRAKLGPPTSCGGVLPLQALGNGALWTYLTFPGFYWRGNASAAIGAFMGTVSPAGQGILKGFTTRRDLFPGTTEGGQTFGRFQVNPDCSGGTLTITGGGNPEQLDFVFVDPALTQMWVLSTTAGQKQTVVKSGYSYSGLNPQVGEAKRY